MRARLKSWAGASKALAEGLEEDSMKNEGHETVLKKPLDSFFDGRR
jgi:hypothetical protein